MKRLCTCADFVLIPAYDSKGDHGSWEYECCNNLCADCQNSTSPKITLEANNTIFHFYQFEAVKNTYESFKTGEEKTSTQTICIQHEENFYDCLVNLQKLRNEYILHRCLISREKFIFPKVCDTISNFGPIFWTDYSKNISNTTKFQPQDAHFNATQTDPNNFSVHCSKDGRK